MKPLYSRHSERVIVGMKYYRIMGSVVMAALCTTAALAEDAPAADKGDMQRRFAEMCIDRQAQAAGEMAYLETRLALTNAQKPLFERWKKVKLATAGDCEPPPRQEPAIVERLKHEQAMLRRRLDEVRTELPALEALAAVLTPEQTKRFDGGPHRRVPIRMHPPENFGPPPPPPEF